MPEKRNLFDPDEVIRDALCRELDSIEAPPVEAAWQRLRLSREAKISEPAESARRRSPRLRYSALVAAVLLFFFGGFGLYRTLSPDGFRGAVPDELAKEERAEVLTAEQFEEEADAGKSVTDFLVGWAADDISGEREIQLPDALNGYNREATFTREAESGILYLAALYLRGEETLLWVQSEARSRAQFSADLEQLLKIVPGPLTMVGERYHLSINNLPALIWGEEGYYFLLMDLSGRFKDTDLSRLLPEN